MTELQFITRMLLTFAIGGFFIFTMCKLARRNCSPNSKTHISYKAIGWILLILGIISGIAGFVLISKIQHPITPIEQSIAPGMPKRIYPGTMYWGHPTADQYMVLSMFMNLFVTTAYGLYFIRFRPSKITWWKKALKALMYIAIYFLISSSTNLHYFDFAEMWPNYILIIIIFCNLWSASKYANIGVFDIAGPTAMTNKNDNHQSSVAVSDVRLKDIEKTNNSVVYETEDVKL